MRSYLVLALIASSIFNSVFAVEDKSQYHLFNPTPKHLLRGLNTDRPDKTESPYTVDAGHIQIESDIAIFNFDSQRRNGQRTETKDVSWAFHNIKLGITNSSDIQFIFESYKWSEFKDLNTGEVEENNGFGDLIIRYKVNLWGNDSGKSSFGLMPFIKLPTNSEKLGNDNVEYGIMFPYAYQLGHGWGLGAMTQIAMVRNNDDDGYAAQWLNTLTFSKSLTKKLSAFTEVASSMTFQDNADWPTTFDFGFLYLVNPNLQLDTGAFIGINESAQNFSPFIGVTYRI